MQKVYVDSCVYISFLTNEMNCHGKFKGQNYFHLFELFFSKKYKLVTSTWVFREIKNFLRTTYRESDFSFISNLIAELKEIDNVEVLTYDEEDKLKANELDSKNYCDALHVVLALKSSCLFLTTENMIDFVKFGDLIKVVHPKDLI